MKTEDEKSKIGKMQMKISQNKIKMIMRDEREDEGI